MHTPDDIPELGEEIELVRNADIMVCLCWDDQEVMAEDDEVHGQCGTTGIGLMSETAGHQKLVLVHMGPHVSNTAPSKKASATSERSTTTK